MDDTDIDDAVPIFDRVLETFLTRLGQAESDPNVTLRLRSTLLEDRRFDEASLERAIFGEDAK